MTFPSGLGLRRNVHCYRAVQRDNNVQQHQGVNDTNEVYKIIIQ